MNARVRRRDFLRTMGLGAATLAAPAAVSRAAGAKPTNPNIVFIMADDMGYGDLACQNPETKIPTPNMDRLAAQGVRFTDAHSGSAVCTPTRYGVVTGRYSWRTRLKRGVLGGYSPPLIEKGRTTVAALLKQHGYATACVGKWHLGLDWARRAGVKGARHKPNVDFARPIAFGPVNVGFDYFFGIAASLDMPPYVYIENDRAVAVPTRITREGGRQGLTAEGFKARNVLPDITRKCVAWIDQHARKSTGQPFFLYFPLTAPHTPVVPTDEFTGKSKAGAYGDFVVEVDWSVGEVMKALDRAAAAGNTLIVVTSDNGPERHMMKRKDDYHHDSSRPLRGMKRDAWDGGHRVPFIARWPGKIRPSSACGETICLTDLMATCAAIAGAELPNDAAEDSYSILPALLGRKLAKPIREATVHHSSRGEFAIRQGPWKLILCRGSGGNRYPSGPNAIKKADPPGQLYDMSKDIAERENLYRQRPEIVRRLTALLDKYKKQGRSRPLK